MARVTIKLDFTFYYLWDRTPNTTDMKRLLPLLAILMLGYCASEDEKAEPIFDFKEGCTVPLADNYDPEAQIDDGSCHAITCSTCTYTIPAAKVVIDGEVL